MICLYCSLALRDILYTSMARNSLFVLKVPLNTKQTNDSEIDMSFLINGKRLISVCTLLLYLHLRKHRPLL